MPILELPRAGSKRQIVTVSHVCGHDQDYPMHPSITDARRKAWVKEKAKERCTRCIAEEQRVKTRKNRQR